MVILLVQYALKPVDSFNVKVRMFKMTPLYYRQNGEYCLPYISMLPISMLILSLYPSVRQNLAI